MKNILITGVAGMIGSTLLEKLLKKKFRYNKKVKYQKQKFGWPGDILTYKYSTLKMKKAGFKFKLSSKEAIEKTIKSISKNLLK